MNERELNELLWRSCYLGIRLAFQSLGVPDSFEQVKQSVRILDAVARNETALVPPSYDLTGLDPEAERLAIAIGTQGVLSERELAERILAVLHQPATEAENPADPLPLHPVRPPLRLDDGGVIRVGTSRISLDLLVEQYENGMAPEDLVRAYDTLALADVYAVIAYYLRRRDEVRAYLKHRAEEAETLRENLEAERPRVAREELLQRRAAREKDNASSGQ